MTNVSVNGIAVAVPLALSFTTPDKDGGFALGCADICPVPSFSLPFCCVKLAPNLPLKEKGGVPCG